VLPSQAVLLGSRSCMEPSPSEAAAAGAAGAGAAASQQHDPGTEIDDGSQPQQRYSRYNDEFMMFTFKVRCQRALRHTFPARFRSLALCRGRLLHNPPHAHHPILCLRLTLRPALLPRWRCAGAWTSTTERGARMHTPASWPGGATHPSTRPSCAQKLAR
jgi:hypothetical protein